MDAKLHLRPLAKEHEVGGITLRVDSDYDIIAWFADDLNFGPNCDVLEGRREFWRVIGTPEDAHDAST